MTNFILENELKCGLNNNEEILWSGKPHTDIKFRYSDIFFIPFSFLWAGFALFWEYNVVKLGIPFMMLWGVPFVLMGAYITIGRFIADAARRSKTIYGITPTSVLIKTGLFKQDITILTIQNLHDIKLSTNKDGSGTITFDSNNVSLYWMEGFDWLGHKQPSRFEGIDNVKEVYNQILHLQQQRKVA